MGRRGERDNMYDIYFLSRTHNFRTKESNLKGSNKGAYREWQHNSIIDLAALEGRNCVYLILFFYLQHLSEHLLYK